MLRSMSDLKGYTIGATDGEIGHVTDFFFDDQRWTIRYLVVETGSWLMSRKVLISPFSLAPADWEHKRLPVHISREAVKNSPDIDTNKPVSRQHETQYADYYGYPYYWGGDALWGNGLYTPALTPPPGLSPVALANVRGDVTGGPARAAYTQQSNDNPHLRSCEAVIGYHLEASDGDIGHVQGMLVEEDTWAIRYLVLDTSNWWLGHQVLMAPDWVSDIRWNDAKVSVNLTRQAIQQSPKFDPSTQLTRQQELDLYHHYARPNYWEQARHHAPETL
ncbi:MAG: photosystem reaction center subunit H [Rhodoferax ferrireducens]|uniref:Photosystem reaction center subunit H n=1 Tax=Rhodoferax ferrireducens TaxID=192843 RepID=A0A1W9KSQ8_9BURK|nr:MAG: photosystem reaction center subunit H [Rhodoferax ferrireducens]